MIENFRQFEAKDPFDRVWRVEFRWQQNAISIRHSDSVDCKYYLATSDETREMVIALMHAELLAVAAEQGRELTDAWCLHLAGLHLEYMITTWEDMDKTIVTVPRQDLVRHSLTLEAAARKDRERALYTH